ncbi:hypothetical protein KY345_03750 [Candidatus Woesearchaeota archaeon]|nr:hypothetical protein [Candidatus Woesearchaeota archaeon]
MDLRQILENIEINNQYRNMTRPKDCISLVEKQLSGAWDYAYKKAVSYADELLIAGLIVAPIIYVVGRVRKRKTKT